MLKDEKEHGNMKTLVTRTKTDWGKEKEEASSAVVVI